MAFPFIRFLSFAICGLKRRNDAKIGVDFMKTNTLSSLINQAKIDDFHIFINISAGIYSSVLSDIPFERGIN